MIKTKKKEKTKIGDYLFDTETKAISKNMNCGGNFEIKIGKVKKHDQSTIDGLYNFIKNI
jgi:hypothetical protein